VLAVRGLGFGGNDIDRELFEQLFNQRLGLDPKDDQISPLPNRHRQIRNLREYLNVLRDPDAVPIANTSAQIDGNEDLFAYILHMRNHRGIELYRNLMAAKSKLEQFESMEFPYRLTSDITWDTQINEDHVAVAFGIYEYRVRDTIAGVLQDAGWEYADVEHIVLSGGSSRLMTFRRYLSLLFPESQVSMGDSFTNVLEGLGIRAKEIWS
jgi:molecular chaperone DnaK (HSP70)